MSREVAAANRLQELTGSMGALEQRQSSTQAQAAEAEKLRAELDTRQRALDEQV